MRILDAYILARVLRPLGLVFAAFVGIFILVDLFDHAHTFIDNRVALTVVAAYYAYYMPLIVVLTAPVAMLLATLLAVGRLSQKNEIMAMKGSGLSLYRVLAPPLMLSLLVSLASIAVAETVLPPSTRQRLRIEEEHIKKKPDRVVRTDVIHLSPDGSILLARRFDTRRMLLEGVTIERFGRNLAPTERIDAASARWSGDHWILEDGQRRSFTGGAESSTSFKTYELPLTEPSPDDLRSRRLDPEEMSFRQLKRYIARLRAGGNDPGDLGVHLHLKIALPFATFIMTLIGAPLAAGARRTGFALSFTAALAISFLYYGLMQVGRVLGQQRIVAPPLAAWLANMAFAAVGVWLFARAPK